MILTDGGGNELFAGYEKYNSWLICLGIEYSLKKKLLVRLRSLWRKIQNISFDILVNADTTSMILKSAIN